MHKCETKNTGGLSHTLERSIHIVAARRLLTNLLTSIFIGGRVGVVVDSGQMNVFQLKMKSLLINVGRECFFNESS